MKHDAPMSYWLRIRWMVQMWILLVATCLAPLASFAYDEQNQTTVGYDTSGECGVGYEARSVLATGEKINGANRDRFPFAEFARFLAAKGPLRVDPAELRLPPSRAEGADPFKLADQIKKYGTSTEGMPPIQVTRGANGEIMINDGVTRVTRGYMTPGTTVSVQVIEENPGLNLGNLPKVGERTPGRP